MAAPSYTTLYEAAKQSQSKFFQGLAMSVVKTDQLAAAMPIRFTGQDLAIVYAREGTPPESAWIPDNGTMSAPTSGTTDLVHAQIREAGSDVDVRSLSDRLTGGQATSEQLGRKARATWNLVTTAIARGGNTTSYALSSSADPFAAIDGMAFGPFLDSDRRGPGSLKYVHSTTSWYFRAPGDRDYGDPVVANADGVYVLRSDNRSMYIVVTLDVSDATANGETLIRFASSTNEFDGMSRLCSADQVIASSLTDGDDFSFAKLDELIDMVKVRENLAFVMHSKLRRKFFSATRSLGGIDPDHIALAGYNGNVATYRSIPILVNDNLPTDEAKGASTTLSSVYLAALDGSGEGLCLGVPSAQRSFDVNADPRTAPVAGWSVTNIGELEGSAKTRTRINWAGALCLGSSLALARAKEIKTV